MRRRAPLIWGCRVYPKGLPADTWPRVGCVRTIDSCLCLSDFLSALYKSTIDPFILSSKSRGQMPPRSYKEFKVRSAWNFKKVSLYRSSEDTCAIWARFYSFSSSWRKNSFISYIISNLSKSSKFWKSSGFVVGTLGFGVEGA